VRQTDLIPLIPDLEPPELLVYDEISPCPYLAGQQARMPLRLPIRALDPADLDVRLRQGDRRHGMLLYRPTCPACQACQAIRIPVDRFRPGKTHRRILAANDSRVRMAIRTPTTTRARILLYDKHLTHRRLRNGDEPLSLARYRQFLADTCCTTVELSYWVGDRLVGVAITDVGTESLSAHYTFYDPDLSRWSLGTYSILKQLELARARGLAYVYLGLFVVGNERMRYKARFLPHERLIDGVWTAFEKE
jgi:arginyl-tRNA--protein-N-Asp/Glu arginylyltransferase